MSSAKAWFLGRTIIHVGFTYQTVSLGFEDGSGVTIHNPCSIAEGFHPGFYIGGRTLTEFWGPDECRLELDNGSRIVVDLRNEAWTGPEAMVFSTEDHVVMVLNEPPGETEIFREERT